MVALALGDAGLQVDGLAQAHVARLRVRGRRLQPHGSFARVERILVADQPGIQLRALVMGEGQRVAVGLEA